MKVEVRLRIIVLVDSLVSCVRHVSEN